ncbi:MAG: Ribose-phosphate pyrophosphokinase [Candidatus Woesebacteria bacterium GW2011_GWA2_40_7]|uniref:ribose-phosphate diphosphokinase n=3 Tax=Candidatus Woeseibacteriota TaxID=1752722 RepID=A0A0G0XX55_9BACT|nr:MAG: Ribose-phosphate pyrophosphokinase [Candidatus Woesebacteria bacterium GW2011_GWB1_39_10]KKR73084.1 MAG: Ribose-phosphate pyrophosphokinase [Candidatus Woesebacteria bacterium GW2011_GWA2_40_7]KKR92507.1 MAG: Ribose-phosphate pyrophosphokinase [Candidatus Woesebacteria bacterium GW2011_GWA1_41_13b]
MKNIILATSNAKHLGLDNGDLIIGRFPDREVSVVLNEDVKNKNVVVIGSTEPPAENLVELLLSIDTVFHHGAKSITVVIPYLGYSKSDMEKVPGQSVSSRVLVNLIESIGGMKLKIIAVDLHSKRIVKFFKVPLRHISLIKELAERFKYLKNLSIVSPDEGGVNRAMEFAKYLGQKKIVRIRKNRISPTSVKILEVLGDVKDKNVVLVDDMVQSGGTTITATATLKENGAKNIYVASVHMDYSGGGWKKLEKSKLIKKVITSNSVKPPSHLPKKFEIIDIAPALETVISSRT